MASNDLRMEDKNPLELTPLYLPKISQQTNKRGRPSSAKVVKYSPQPKSIISRLLRSVREENCDNFTEVNLSNIESNVCHSSYSMNKNDFHHKISLNTEKNNSTNTYDSVQGENFTFDLTTLKDNHDSCEDSCILKNKEPNDYQISTSAWGKKYEDNSKLVEILCYVCSHISNSDKAHRKHLSVHRNQPYACNFPDCKYTCKLSCNLIKHKRIHTSEKPYLCDQCTFRSNFANSLKVHKRIHTSERPYCCQHCSYRCNSSSNLKKHCLHKHSNIVGM